MLIEITPMDTLFFRDGKPFNASEDGVAGSMFPPNPSVLYGFLRSLYFGETKNIIENIRIKGIYYKINNVYYFPSPLDFVRKKTNNKGVTEYQLLKLKKEKSNFISNANFEEILNPTANIQVESLKNGIIKLDTLESYLHDEETTISAKSLNDIYINENKTGIKKGIKGNVEEGYLYRINMLRFLNKDFQIVIDFDLYGEDRSENEQIFNNIINENKLSKLGGEGKSVSIKIPDKKTDTISKINITTKEFKIYLSTPTYFANGCYPNFLMEENKEGFKEFKGFGFICDGVKVKLRTAAIGKSINIGGFDIVKRNPNPMFKAVPAGSVYYFEIIESKYQSDNECIEKIIEKIDTEGFIDKMDNYNLRNEGYGMAYIGRV